MAILIPILFPLTYQLGAKAGLTAAEIDQIGHAALAAVLGGSVFGDHCSPISDTTVLSSMSSGADHVDHVRTQLPYAVLVATLSIPAYLLVGFGTPIVVVHLISIVTLLGVFFLLSSEKKLWPLFRTR
jgi:Na+/H+ antiporter NhaC